ncbi:putative bifunctional diguanylate cyclase/phosphodiesterase [Parasphingorhabdus halotolerans]|nr:bifunctional diguanylate cyclase/phosphodiesterase [Parasphingorhabdus halotolerans]
MIVDKTLSKLSNADRQLVTREQLLEHGKVIGSSVIGNLLAAAMLTFIFHKHIPPVALSVWWMVYLINAVDRLLLKARTRTAVGNAELLEVKKRLTINAVFNANLWGSAAVAMTIVASPLEAGLLMAVCAGVMGVGAMTYRCMPDATRAWLTTTPVCFAIGLLFKGDIVSLVATVMLIVYAYLLFENNCRIFAGFVELLLSRQEIEERSETVKLLLNDFEEQSSNWLFAIDQQGRLVDVCDRFAEAAQLPAEQLNGATLISLFEQDGNRDSLNDHLANGRSFRDLALITDISGKHQCWSISGRAAATNNKSDQAANENDIVLRGVIADMTAQMDAEKKASYLLRFDSLTDLPNRRLFSETLNRAMFGPKDGLAMADAPRPVDKKIALLLFDVDHFQAVNDNHGAEVGDKVLQIMARRFAKFVGSEDTLARTGGDEFSLLLTGDRAGRAREIAAETVEHLASVFGLDGLRIYLEFSVGISLWNGGDHNVDRLIKEANLALQTAKESGRNRITHFENGMYAAAEERRRLEHELIESLGNGQMKVYYQPVINLKTQDEVGYEALVRWEHPELGLVMPDKFIPLAEETGLIVQLGEWVIRNAVDEAASWSNQHMVAVNLSPAQMRSANLIPSVVNALASSGLDPARLELEITENILMHDSDSNLRTLHSLRAIGVRVSLDDFGTGYSSLNYLRAFPFDKIKIDRCFVSDVDSRDESRAIVRSVIDLARSLGMQTTAEGVERESQAQQLITEGCDQVQGYLYGKAAPLKSGQLQPSDRVIVSGDFVERRNVERNEEVPTKRKQA